MTDVDFPTFDPASLCPGPTRKLCETFAPHTEAYGASLAAEYLSGMGAVLGPNVFVLQGPTRHPARVNVLLIGESGYGRKGTAHSLVSKVLSEATGDFFPAHVVDGLASGQGLSRALINLGRQTNDDFRLWIVEEEAVNILTAGSRGANNMSAVIRKAFDSGNINVHRSRSSVVITGAHIGIVGHMTEEELRGRLPRVDAINGFMNRFMMIGARFTGAKKQRDTVIPDSVMDAMIEDTSDVLSFAQSITTNKGAMHLTWDKKVDDEYDDFRHEHIKRTMDLTGSYAAAVRRADTHVLRMAMLFAVLDREQKIGWKHLESAIAMWKYADDTARYVFRAPDEHADEDLILAALTMSGPRGMNSQERRELVGRNYARLEAAEQALVAEGKIVLREVKSKRGKPAKMAWTTEHAPTDVATAGQFDSLTVMEEGTEQVFDQSDATKAEENAD